MTETTWLVTGIDTETRQRAAEMAERLGVSLADYLTEALLEAGAPMPPPRIARSPAAQKPRENLAIRHRLEALEQRLSLATGGLDNAIATIDSSVFSLEHRLETIEDVAKTARQASAALADAHDALKYAVADEFTDLAQHTAEQLASGLEAVRAEAQRAAAEADAAFNQLLGEFISFRETVEARLTESAAETRGRMQASFADIAGQLSGLTERVVRNDNTLALAALSATIDALGVAADASAAGHDAKTTHVHRVLSGDIARVEACTMAALEKLSADMVGGDELLARQAEASVNNAAARIDEMKSRLECELADLRGQHAGAVARLRLIDRTLGNLGEAAATPVLDRLSALEAGASAAPFLESMAASLSDRLAMLERRDLAADFENLRQRLEDRMLGVEIRGVRTLEQLGETIALIERGFASEGDQEEALRA